MDQNNSTVTSQEEAKAVAANYLADPKVQADLNKWSQYFTDRFRGNTFTIAMINKKTPLKKPEDAAHIVNLLTINGQLVQIQKKKEVVFKIIPSKELRLEYLRNHLIEVKEYHVKQIQGIEANIARLEKELELPVIEK
jgi:hypothetical protein